MSNHQISLRQTADGAWYAQCGCRHHSGYGSRQDAEDWGHTHLRQVERAKSHLRGRAPSLREEYAYYRCMEADLDNPPDERALWKILADGLEHRLGQPHTEEAMF